MRSDMWSAWQWEMKTADNRSVSIPDLRIFRSAPGPRSNTVDSSTSIEGQARFALTADPPDPRKVSFIKTPTAVSALNAFFP